MKFSPCEKSMGRLAVRPPRRLPRRNPSYHGTGPGGNLPAGGWRDSQAGGGIPRLQRRGDACVNLENSFVNQIYNDIFAILDYVPQTTRNAPSIIAAENQRPIGHAGGERNNCA